MATVTKTIGTSARDYSTVTLWEADLDDSGIYSSGDDAVGELYNDSVFDEVVTINGGGTVGLNSRKLTSPVAERHDGTAGIGARIERVVTNAFVMTLSIAPTTIEFIEILAKRNGNYTAHAISRADTGSLTVANNILHYDDYGVSRIGDPTGISQGVASGTHYIMNNLVYDFSDSIGGRGIYLHYGTHEPYNNTVYRCYNGFDEGSGSTSVVKNNIAVSSDNADFQGFESGDGDYNCDSDSTAMGANSITSSAANLFTSTVVGSEDLHLKAGADAIDAGTDLGTTPDGVQYDIDGRDRDVQGDVWDMGADELVAAVVADTPITALFHRFNKRPIYQR